MNKIKVKMIDKYSFSISDTEEWENNNYPSIQELFPDADEDVDLDIDSIYHDFISDVQDLYNRRIETYINDLPDEEAIESYESDDFDYDAAIALNDDPEYDALVRDFHLTHDIEDYKE